MTLLQSMGDPPIPSQPTPSFPDSPGKGCCPKPPLFLAPKGREVRGVRSWREKEANGPEGTKGSLHLNQSGEFSPLLHTTVVVWTGQTFSSSLPHFKSSSLCFLFLLSRPSAFHHRGMEEEHFLEEISPFFLHQENSICTADRQPKTIQAVQSKAVSFFRLFAIMLV